MRWLFKTTASSQLAKEKKALEGVLGREFAARLHAVKERMIGLGYCRDAREVEKEVEERHEALRRPVADRPRRRHAAEPPPPAYG